MQSSSTTHCPPFALRKRYAWRRRRICTTRYAFNPKIATGCTRTEFAQRSTRSNENKTQERLVTNPADQRVPGKPGTTPWTTESLAYTFPQSNSRIQIAKTRSKSWLSSSRASRTRNPSFRTWNRRGRSTSSARNRRSSSPTWTTLRSSNFAKPLPKSNAPIAIYTGSSALFIALVEDVSNRRKELRRSTRTTTTSYQFLAMLSKRITVAVPNMDLLSDSECTTRPRICCKKLVNPSMDDTIPYSKDGIVTPNIESVLSDIGWTEEQIIEYDKIALEDHSHVATRAERIQDSKHWILKLNQDRAQQPSNQRPGFAQECKRLHDEYMARTQPEYRTILRSQQVRQRRGQAFEGIEEYDCSVDPRTGWRFYKQSQGDLSSSSSSINWERNNWTTRSWNSLHFHGLTIRDFFLRVQDQFLLTWDKLPNNRRYVWTEHPLTQHVQMRTVCQHIHCTAWSHVITRTRVAQERTAQDWTHWCLKNSLLSTRHVSFLAAPDTDHQHKFSLTCLIYLPVVLSLTVLSFGFRSIKTLRRFTAEWRIHCNPMSHRLWAQSDPVQRPWTKKNWAWQESWDRSISNPGKNYGRWLSKFYHWRCGRIWISCCRDALRPIKDTLRYDSGESIADSDLEDGELREMLASPLYIRERGENFDSSRRPKASGKPEAEVIQKRGASAHCTQAGHSRRESLMSSSSQDPRASGRPDAVFSSSSSEHFCFLICWSIEIGKISS